MVGGWQGLVEGRLPVLDFTHWLCSEPEQNAQILKCYTKKNSLWLMTFRLQYIRRKIKWVIWKYIGNASFLPNCQNGTPSFDFQPHKNFIFLCVELSRGFFKLLSEKGGRNCERVEIFEKWCRDFKSLVYWHWVYTAVMQCITMNRIKYHLSLGAL